MALIRPRTAQRFTSDALRTDLVHATRALGCQRPTRVVIDDLHLAPDEGPVRSRALAAAVLAANGTLGDAVWLTWDANRIYMEHAPTLGAAGHLAKWHDAVAGAAAPWLLAAIALGAALLRPAPPDPDVAPRAWDLLAEDLRARPPALVIDSSPSGYRGYHLFPPAKFPKFDEWLRANYVPAGNVGKYALWAPK